MDIEVIRGISSQKLLSMIDNAEDYEPSAISLAEAEVERRGGMASLQTQLDQDRIRDATEREHACAERSKHRKKMIKRVAICIGIASLVTLWLVARGDAGKWPFSPYSAYSRDTRSFSERMSRYKEVPGTNIRMNGWVACGLPFVVFVSIIIGLGLGRYLHDGVVVDPQDDELVVCPVCSAKYNRATKFCAKDGARLGNTHDA